MLEGQSEHQGVEDHIISRLDGLERRDRIIELIVRMVTLHVSILPRFGGKSKSGMPTISLHQ